MIYFLLYGVVGIFSGLIAGLLGIGGGIVIVPILIFTFTLNHVPKEIIAQVAIATSLAVIIVNSLVSIYTHQRHGAIRWEMLRGIILGILAGAVLGVNSALFMSSELLTLVFGVFLFTIGIIVGFGLVPKPGQGLPGRLGASSAGIVIGWVSAMLGIGGGTLSVPYFIGRNLPMRNAIAMGAACGLPISVMATIVYIYQGWNLDIPWGLGYVYLPALAGIAITSIPAATFGAYMAHRINPRNLQIGFSIVMCLVGLKFIFQ